MEIHNPHFCPAEHCLLADETLGTELRVKRSSGYLERTLNQGESLEYQLTSCYIVVDGRCVARQRWPVTWSSS
jgi:hypothetical protein